MIPEMLDPLGRHWDQPGDIRSAPMDDTHVILTQAQFERLPEYSASLPSGVYPGKCWRRHNGAHDPRCKNPEWLFAWYGECDDPKKCSINYRKILLA